MQSTFQYSKPLCSFVVADYICLHSVRAYRQEESNASPCQCIETLVLRPAGPPFRKCQNCNTNVARVINMSESRHRDLATICRVESRRSQGGIERRSGMSQGNVKGLQKQPGVEILGDFSLTQKLPPFQHKGRAGVGECQGEVRKRSREG